MSKPIRLDGRFDLFFKIFYVPYVEQFDRIVVVFALEEATHGRPSYHDRVVCQNQSVLDMK